MLRFGRWSCACALALVSLLLIACSDDDPEPGGASGTPDPTPAVTASSDDPEGTPAGTVELEVWFTQDDDLFLGHREVPGTEAVGKAAMEALLDGISGAEAVVDVVSVIPEGTELLGLSIADGVATVDLSVDFESGGGSASILARLAQVVYTLTQFPTVDGVEFEIEGEPVDTFSGEGIVLDGPQTRRWTTRISSPRSWSRRRRPGRSRSRRSWWPERRTPSRRPSRCGSWRRTDVGSLMTSRRRHAGPAAAAITPTSSTSRLGSRRGRHSRSTNRRPRTAPGSMSSGYPSRCFRS